MGVINLHSWGHHQLRHYLKISGTETCDSLVPHFQIDQQMVPLHAITILIQKSISETT